MSIYSAIAELEKNNEAGALCTVVRSQGSTPRHVGSKMLVYPDGRFIGTIGGGEMENRVIAAALEALHDSQPRLLEYNFTDPQRATRAYVGARWRCLWNLSFQSPHWSWLAPGTSGALLCTWLAGSASGWRSATTARNSAPRRRSRKQMNISRSPWLSCPTV